MSATLWQWACSLALAALALLAPVHALLVAVGFLIAADFVLGVAAALKKGEPLTSKAASRTIYKSLAYNMAVISGFALEGLVPGGLPIAKLCAAAIGLVEFKSLVESVKVLTGTDLRSILERVSSQGRDPK